MNNEPTYTPGTIPVGLIVRAWNKHTSACPEEWSKANRSRGQCAVTALVVQDAIGGTLLRALVNGESHYWNRAPDGTELDLTLKQFGENPVIEPPIEERTREYVLSFPETVRRYRLLLHRVESVGHLDWLVRVS